MQIKGITEQELTELHLKSSSVMAIFFFYRDHGYSY